MDFQTAISTCFTKYVEFTGRARRSEFWYFFLFSMLLNAAASVVDQGLPGDMMGNVVSIALLMPSLGVGVRRMHDIGKSGWFILIPIYNIFLFATDTDPNPNQWGVPAK
ncbi:MAG: putative cytochrome [Actinomycetota bacterium]